MTENEKDGYQKLWKYVGYYLGKCKNSIKILKVYSYAFDCISS